MLGRSLRHALHERARSVALLQKHSRSCPKHHRRLSVRKRETLDVLELDTNETLRANPRYIYTVTETGAPELQKDRVSFSGRWITFVGKKATNRRGALVLFHSCTLCGKYTRRCSRHAPRRRREFPRPSCSWRASASPRIDLEREREREFRIEFGHFDDDLSFGLSPSEVSKVQAFLQYALPSCVFTYIGETVWVLRERPLIVLESLAGVPRRLTRDQTGARALRVSLTRVWRVHIGDESLYKFSKCPLRSIRSYRSTQLKGDSRPCTVPPKTCCRLSKRATGPSIFPTRRQERERERERGLFERHLFVTH